MGKIGPHNGQELKLMLEGKKPLAMFTLELEADPYELGDEDFQSAVDEGKIQKYVFREEKTERRYYCLPTEEWRVKLLEVLLIALANNKEHGFTVDDLHRIDGTLLGYRKDEIEYFIERWHLRNVAIQK